MMILRHCFYYATDMESDNFKFTYGNRDYIFWAWKGDYLNLGAGAELGIYSNQSGVGGHGSITCPFSDHWLVDTNLAMKMTLTLNDTNGNQLFLIIQVRNNGGSLALTHITKM